MPVASGASTSLRFQAGRQEQGLAPTPLATQARGLCVDPELIPPPWDMLCCSVRCQAVPYPASNQAWGSDAVQPNWSGLTHAAEQQPG